MAKFKATNIIRNVLKQHGIDTTRIWTNKYKDGTKRTVKIYADEVIFNNGKRVNDVKLVSAVIRELAKHGEHLSDVRAGVSRQTHNGYSPESIIFEVNV